MILLGLPCDFCHSPTVAHCSDGRCEWNRCPRCMSYGLPGRNFVKWNAADYMNPYTLSDVKIAPPKRKFPSWLEEDYGRNRNT